MAAEPRRLFVGNLERGPAADRLCSDNEKCQRTEICAARWGQNQIDSKENEPLTLTLSPLGGERETDSNASDLKIPCVFEALREIFRVERLGKNHGGYHGETIDIRAALRDIEIAARQHGWRNESFGRQGEFNLFALHRKSEVRSQRSEVRIYLSTGIHGDEPAGPLAALRLLRENRWPEGAEVFLTPCLNPTGFLLNKRENADGVDLNRDYRNPKSAEVRAHIAWLERQPPFDLYLCLHEDWESHGFYLYEQNPDKKPSLAEKMVEAVKPVCPIDLSETIEGRTAQNGIVRPNIQPHERPDWPEAFYLITHMARLGYTLEAPSDFPLMTRMNALVAGAHAALENWAVV